MRAKQVRIRKPSRRLRVESDEHAWFVTTRVTEGRFWLHPLLTAGLKPPNRAARRLCARHERHFDKRIATCVTTANKHRRPHQPIMTVDIVKRIARGCVGSAFARAQQMYGTQVFGLVVLSNHLHALIRTRGKNLAAFMGMVKSAITSTINLITGKRGSLWEDRYHAEPAVDDQGCAGRMGYLVDNPTKANCVQDPQHWPGLNLAYGFADDDRIEFEYLDRSAWHRANRPADLSPFFFPVTLVLSPLPCCEGLSRQTCLQSLQRWIEDARSKHKAEQPQHNDGHRRAKHPLGVEAVLFAPFDTRPKAPDSRRRPYVFGSAEACAQYTRAHVARMQAYAELSERYRAGDHDVQFPDGMYPPPIVRAA